MRKERGADIEKSKAASSTKEGGFLAYPPFHKAGQGNDLKKDVHLVSYTHLKLRQVANHDLSKL